MSESVLADHEYLNVRELAELLRIKERKVYDLAASGDVPCVRATGKLLFPAAEVRAWIANAGRGGTARPAAEARPPIVLGSHDPLLDWAIRQSGCGLAAYFDGSLDGLDRFAKGEGIAAGLHIAEGGAESWNVATAAARCSDQDAVLIAFATRRRGLVTKKNGPKLSSIGDLRGSRVVPRQPESGTQQLFADLVEDAGLSLAEIEMAEVARTEVDVVTAVAMGQGDVAFGLQTVANMFSLPFAGIVDERFDLLVDRRAYFGAPMQKLLAFCRSDEFASRAAAFGGYDIGECGAVRWNA